MITLGDIEAAQKRIAPFIRRTPHLYPMPLKGLPHDYALYLKLETLQVTGCFKARGAFSALTRADPQHRQRGVIAASGGNHGRAVAYAAQHFGIQATIVLPDSTPAEKIDRIRRFNAQVVLNPGDMSHAISTAETLAQTTGGLYIHPFAHPDVIAGQGTMGLEIYQDLPQVDTVLVAIGGGGMIAGIATALKNLNPRIKMIGVEPEGAACVHASLKKGEVVDLKTITTEVGTLAARRTEPLNFSIIQQHVDGVVLVSDQDMRRTSALLWQDLNLPVEMSGGASLAALLAKRYTPRPQEKVLAILCGAGTDALDQNHPGSHQR
ncbi:MAG: threonine/serine dehydratase [Holosporales bacterium]